MKILPVLLLMLPLTAYAEWGHFDIEFENEKPWLELSAQLPPTPKPENLVGFDVSPATQNKYFVDTASIRVGEDKVVRYSVVIEAAGGAKNVSFEGMRCATGERRPLSLRPTAGRPAHRRQGRLQPGHRRGARARPRRTVALGRADRGADRTGQGGGAGVFRRDCRGPLPARQGK